MNFFRIFKGLLDLKCARKSLILTRIIKKCYIYFPQALAQKDITKMLRNISRTRRKFLGIFMKSFR
jgi:hypothetical protein